jgi:hypothetical protein
MMCGMLGKQARTHVLRITVDHQPTQKLPFKVRCHINHAPCTDQILLAYLGSERAVTGRHAAWVVCLHESRESRAGMLQVAPHVCINRVCLNG